MLPPSRSAEIVAISTQSAIVAGRISTVTGSAVPRRPGSYVAHRDVFQRGLEVGAAIALVGAVVAVATMRTHLQHAPVEEGALQEAA